MDNINKKDWTNIEFNGFVFLSQSNKKSSSGSFLWITKCKCGKIFDVLPYLIISGLRTSCGCSRKEKAAVIDRTGLIFNNLKFLKSSKEKYKKSRNVLWEVECYCDNIFIAKPAAILNGQIKSCGENNHKIPIISSAKHIYQDYKCIDITFEEFYELTQKNCYYCNREPSNKYRIKRKTKISKYALENGEFIYNGLDRVDNTLQHTKDNVVPCCRFCNQSKMDLCKEEFLDLVIKIYKNINRKQDAKIYTNQLRLFDVDKLFINDIKKSQLHPMIVSAKSVWSITYKDGNISFEDFFDLINYNCFYCGKTPSTKRNTNEKHKIKEINKYREENGTFTYNGLDRIDSSKLHTIDNIIPCCKNCNKAKSNLSVEEFYENISRIYNHLKLYLPKTNPNQLSLF